MNTSITSGVIPEQKEQCVRVVSDAARKGAGMAIDELAELGTFNTAKMQRVLAQGNKLAAAIIAVVMEKAKEKIVELADDIIGCLKKISGDKEVIIGATDGKETLVCAGDIFSSIDPNFIKWGCDAKEKPTPKTSVEMYEIIEDATYQHIFGGFGQNLDRLCFTQAQIRLFAKDHKDCFCKEGLGTFLLFKVEAKKGGEQDEYLVARVRLFSVGYLVLQVERFSPETVHRAKDHYLVIIPKLT